MRKLFVSAIVLGLFAVTSAAFAEGDHNRGDNTDQSGKSDQGSNSHQHGNSYQDSNSYQGNNSHQSGNVYQGRNSNPRGNSYRDSSSYRHGNSYQGGKSYNANGYNGTRMQAQSRNTQSISTHTTVTTNRSANFASLQRNVQASHQFHAGVYRQPYGYESRHWGYGERLPRAYYGRDYWITDYAMYSLFAPDDGLVWVRVGDDVMLVNEYTGEIVQVDYGEFY